MEQTTGTPSLGFLEAIKKAADNILKFQGRSRRSEYWWTMAIVYIVSIFLPRIGFVLSLLTIPLTFRRLHDTGRSGWWWGACAILQGIVIALYVYDVFSLVSNGLYGNEEFTMWTFVLKYLLLFVVISIYRIVLIVLCCIDSEPHENIYGKSPKYISQ